VPAIKIGLETGVWVNRSGGAMGSVPDELKKSAKFGWQVHTLAELADIVDEAFKNEGK